MYVFRAHYTSSSPWTELDGDPSDMALVVEQALGLALYDRIGVVILERVHIAAHPCGPRHGFSLYLVVRSPDQGTRIGRASLTEAQHAIEAIVLRLLRELFGHVVVEAAGLSYEACDAIWGEAVPVRARQR
jgi:hypothetical protein